MADFNSLKDKLLANLGKAAKATKDIAEKTADKTKGIAGMAADKTKVIADKTKDFAGKATDKAKAGARIAKLNIEIAGEKENMKKTYLEIGKLYYDTHKEDPEGFFIQLCEEIALAEKNISDKEAEIAELKAKDDSIEVEIEEVAEEECVCDCGCKEKVEEIVDKVEDFVEDVVEKIEEKFDD